MSVCRQPRENPQDPNGETIASDEDDPRYQQAASGASSPYHGRVGHFVSSGKSVIADIIVKPKLAATLGARGIRIKDAGQALTDHSLIRVVLSSRLPASAPVG